MRLAKFKMFQYLFAVVLLFHASIGNCQKKNSANRIKADSLVAVSSQTLLKDDTNSWEKIESSINRKGLLTELDAELERRKQLAIKSRDNITLARSLNNLMKIRDLRTEDTLYFRNSAFMDTILDNPNASAALKAIIYILHAQRLNNFDHRPLRFNAAAYRTKNLKYNYAALTAPQRDSIVVEDLEAALNNHPFKGDISSLLWLSSNPDVFLFEPKFQDIVLSERINLVARRYYDYDLERSPVGRWASLPSVKFRQMLDSLMKNKEGRSTVLGSYERWLSFNKSDQAVAMFIESLARKYIYLSFSQDSVSRASYINFLFESINSPYPAFKAHAVYQLCLIWNEDGNRYVNFYNRYQFITGNNFDERYQYAPLKALQLYRQHKELISKYSLFDRVLELMAQQILKSGLRIEMEDKFIPGEAIPVKAIYKNTGTLFYRVIRVNPGETVSNKKRMAPPALLTRTAVSEDKFTLPLPDDHNNHAAYLKLPPLEKGNYCLLFSNRNLKDNPDTVNSIAFRVTGIAAINSDERVYVLDRTTGLPLVGAVVRSFKKGAEIMEGLPAKTGQRGYITIPGDKADSIIVFYKADTLGQSFTAHLNSLPDDVYDKDMYDGLSDFYDDKLTMHVFTDRSIYRPGQTVHYKIIFLTRDPKTGTPILFNSENVGNSFFKNKLNKWIKDKQDLIVLEDPFNRKTDSAKVKINEFGSFAGSFILPKTAATGDWAIKGEPDEDNRNSGEFKVEEYKRPTIELSMEKPKKMLRPGEPFTIKLKLRSFSGADLNDIPINYTLGRYGALPHKKSSSSYANDYQNVKLTDTTGHTDKNGELLIAVNDTLLSRYKFTNEDILNYTYELSATAVDATGESSAISENLNISTRPVKIHIAMDKTYDRQFLPSLNVTTTADFEGTVGRQVAVKLYRVTDPDATGTVRKEVDQWFYPQTEWNKWFPRLAAPAMQAGKTRTLVLDTLIKTGSYQKLTLPKEKLTADFFELEATCEEDHKVIGQSEYNFKVFDSKSGESPVKDIDYLPTNAVKPGETVTWYSSDKNDNYTIYQVLYEAAGKHRVVKNIYQEFDEKKGLRRWTYQIPTNATGTVLLNRVSVWNNQISRHEKRVFLVKTAAEPPEIIVEKYRKVMAPGAEETFTVSIKTKNDNVAAELMTTMYDASLDKLQEHHWNLPNSDGERLYLQTSWDYSLSTTKSSGDYGQSEPQYLVINDLGRSPAEKSLSLLQGKAAGVNITDGSGLNEVVVVGYGAERRRDITGSVATVYIRGASSILDYKQPLIVLDGEIYAGDLNNIPVAGITQAMVLKGADASAIYGSRASEGVLIISTKGPIILPGMEEPVIKIRKNFNETAFFFPQVHAGTDGYYHLSFTMPETATEWNWKILAHTRNAQFAYLEKKLQTQLNLMVQPNMPRLLYQGDQIKLQSRISNLDTTSVTGKISCKIEDAVTGQDITALMVNNSTQNFSLNRKSSGAEYFLVTVPAKQSNPLKIVITVTGGNASDAEEHTIPILSSKVFVRQSIPVHFKNSQSITIPAVNLPKDAQLYGISISIDQKPQAALINALPWLAGYSYDCAEQTFNKLRARAIALRLMQNDTIAQAAFKKASLSAKKDKPKDETLPDELAAEAMPWLSIGNQAADQQKQLFHLLDTNDTKNDIDKRLEKLYKMQQADGGLAWFEGGKSNAYISAYVLSGFGQLKKGGGVAGARNADRQKQFIDKLYKYNQEQILEQYSESPDLFQLYALCYWRDSQDESRALHEKVNGWVNRAWQNQDKLDLEQQALLIINTFRFTKDGDALNRKAQMLLENIKQLAINDAENGLRWKDISDSEELSGSAEETMALLSEAFDLSGKYKDVNPGMLKWVLATRQDQHWQTTKATAAAIGMLQKQKGSTFGDTKAFTAELSGQHLSVSDGLLDGIPTAFAAVDQLPGTINLQQQGRDANGALTWYYFTEPKQLDTLSKAISIRKQFFREDKIRGWVELAPGAVLKVGDNVRVKLTIETSSRLKFVHISDPRAAAFEPKDNNSGYQYANGFSYYRSVKDTGLELFTESVPRGISEINYELVVAMDGLFTSGPATLQCMYQPSVTAYSTIQKFETN